MIVNINDTVRVELTDYGQRVYRDHLEGLQADLPDGRWLLLPLWKLMQIFGPVIHHGMADIPFVNNQIRVGDKL